MTAGKNHTIFTGKRKTAIARVIITPGNGNVKVNKKNISDYFITEAMRINVHKPFVLTSTTDQYDVRINVRGGGVFAQSAAAGFGIAKALLEVNPSFRDILKKENMVTRDARKKERKKPGQKGARKKFQFSKR